MPRLGVCSYRGAAGPARQRASARTEFLPGARDFIETYRARYGAEPGPYAPLTYDGMRLLAWAIEEAGSTEPEAIIAALKSADGKEWLAGPISFTDENTLGRSNFIVLEGKDGAWALADEG